MWLSYYATIVVIAQKLGIEDGSQIKWVSFGMTLSGVYLNLLILSAILPGQILFASVTKSLEIFGEKLMKNVQKIQENGIALWHCLII